MKNLIQSILISLCSSYFIIMLISLKSPNDFWMSETIVKQFFYAVLLGIVIALANQLYKLEWPILVVLIVHYAVTVTVVFVIGYYGGWFELNNTKSIILLYARASIIYLIVWLYYYTDEKRVIRKMNSQLQQRGE
ncbi:DUF3021 domain-containing protein [Solibacillus sp. FSL R5-0449]|uniref:DUF3021 domain-containing protein n=1 Tax=Solibacillus sp. FSL R5-0449 TaxID=2921639 RepID=UPI0030CC2E5A